MEKILDGEIIAVDFDDTIARYHGWKGIGIFGEPIGSVAWALGKFRELGAMVIVHTCRREIQHVADYLFKHKIPYDHINFSPKNTKLNLSDKKIAADMYIDDKGIGFRGDWKETYLQVVNFRRWGKDLGAVSNKG